MDSATVTLQCLSGMFEEVLPHLDERQRRLLLGGQARAVGYGGIRLVARAAGVREATVSAGARELEDGAAPTGRVRRPGAGRRRRADEDPGLRDALLALVEPEERGDPMCPLRWTVKSTRTLAAELSARGHRVSADTVAGLLHEAGFSLQGNAKMLEGRSDPDRDAQFRYIAGQVDEHQRTGQPVVSVDCKKKELVGPYKNGGRQWRPAGTPERVDTHDFPDPRLGRAIPYGVYDVAANEGWVNVGCDHDTAAFAVGTIRSWWEATGRAAYPDARRLLITADAGGSNGYRTRAWKTQLAGFAADTGLQVTVCHFPPGTSKWNKIEHRLFSAITSNWRGRPLTSHEVVVASIAATTNRAGLTVHARLDPAEYPVGVTVTDQELAAVPIRRHVFRGDWNYTIRPTPDPADADVPPPDGAHAGPSAAATDTRTLLTDPAVTGMPRRDFDRLVDDLAGGLGLQRERTRARARSHDRVRAPGAGGQDRLTDSDRVLAAVVYLRRLAGQRVIADLLGVDHAQISRAVTAVRPLLAEHGHTVEPGTMRLTAATDLTALLAATRDTPTS